MNISGTLTRAYFNHVYNTIYDFITTPLSIYRQLQERCVVKLNLKDNDKLLCVGLGTGNEMSHILRMNSDASVTGVDYSSTALRNARKKALKLGKKVELSLMDARHLDFATGSFDKVLCIHVMDFIPENAAATAEIIRVLKEGGQFVITYPSQGDGARLVRNILKDSFHSSTSSRNFIIGPLTFLARFLAGLVYLPLLLRPKPKPYSHEQLKAMYTDLTNEPLEIEEYAVYQDFIVHGRKLTGGA